MDKVNGKQEYKWESWYLGSGFTAQGEILPILANLVFLLSETADFFFLQPIIGKTVLWIK